MQYVEFLIQAEAELSELTCSCYTLTGGGAFIYVSPAVRTSKDMVSHTDFFHSFSCLHVKVMNRT